MEYLLTREVCDILRVHRGQVYRLVKAGELTAIKGQGKNGRLKISRDSLAAYQRRNLVGAGA